MALHVLHSVKASALAELPAEKIEAKQVVVLNTFDLGHAMMPLTRAMEGLPVPERSYQLAPMTADMTVYRTGEFGLEIEAEQGLLGNKIDQLTRGPQHPFEAGYRRDCGLFEVTVLKTTGAAGPSRVRFDFDRNLESADVLWLAIIGGELRQWSPPAVGDSAPIRAVSLGEILTLVQKGSHEILGPTER